MACSSDRSEAPSTSASCPGVEVVVAASDYASSTVCGAPGCVVGDRTTGFDLGKDPQLTESNGRTFFLARDNDLFFELDPRCGTPIARFSVNHLKSASGASANPHDVAVAKDGSLVVALFNTPKLAILKDGQARTIDLSSYDADGNPEIESVRVIGDKAFVALERLTWENNQLLSKQPSQMLRIDVASGAVESVVELAGRNPFNPMKEHAGALFLAEPGSFNAAAEPLAGVERFDTATMTTKLLVQEKDLGGSVTEIAITDGCAAAIVAGPIPDVNPTALVTFDPVTGRVLSNATAPAFGPTPGFDLQGLAWKDGNLYVGDRRSAAPAYRIHVFSKSDACTLHELRTIDLPRPPVALRAARK